jgi:hypothetical protein
VLGIADGEYIETDELVDRGNYSEFLSSDISAAVNFGIEFGWRIYEDFPNAMDKLRAIVGKFSSADEKANKDKTLVQVAALPKKFWKIRDAAIAHVASKSPLPVGIADLQNWLATDGWDSLLAAWINEDVALNLKRWAEHEFTDSSLRDYEGLDDSIAINDQMRVNYARVAINNAIEQSDGYDSPSVHSLAIERKDGERAIIGCTVEIHGQAGPVPHWHGLFADKNAFYRYIREAGFLLHSRANEISDVELLSLWPKLKLKRSKLK